MPLQKTWNDLVYAMAKRAQTLGNLKMDELRLEAGYDCNTPGEARQRNKYRTRGDLIQEVLVEEYLEENDIEINS